MKMKKIGITVVTTLVVGALITPITTITYATPSSDELLDEQAAMESELASIKSELTELLDNITQLETSIEEKFAEIQLAGEAYEGAVFDEEKQYADMKLRIQYMYEASTSSATLENIIQSTSIMDMLNKFEYVNSVYDYDRELLEKYTLTKELVKENQESLEGELIVLEEMQLELEEDKAAFATLIASKSAEIELLDVEIQEAIAAEEEAARIKAAEEEAARIAAAEAAAAAAAAAEEAARLEAERLEAEQNAAENNNSSNDSSSNGSTSTTVPSTSAVVNAAREYLGVPYLWGGTTFKGIDCSGLTQAAYAACGITIPRTSEIQRIYGYTVGYSISDAQPGDILCYDGHVAIYSGNGMMIHAPYTGSYVCEVTARTSGLLKVVRYS